MATQKDPELPPSHGHNKSTIINGKISTERNPKTTWPIPAHQVNMEKKNPYQNKYERLTHNVTINATLGMETHNQEESNNLELLTEERRVWNPHLAPQLLRSALEGGVPKTSSFKNNQVSYLQDPQSYSKLRKSS